MKCLISVKGLRLLTMYVFVFKKECLLQGEGELSTSLSNILSDHVISADFQRQYVSAEPYPHIVFDDFLKSEIIQEVCDEFPSDGEYIDFKSGYAGNLKKAFKPEVARGSAAWELFSMMQHPEFLNFLERLTGIEGLIPDPYYEGGGFHQTSRGGKLGIHADFRIHRKLNLSRRINIIIYLNQKWEESWGGGLEIWDRSAKNRVKTVAPVFNRAIIFNTDATSYHGHPSELNCPPDFARKSIALYYYTASKSIYVEIPNNNTNYVNDGSLSLRENFSTKVKYFVWKLIPPLFVEWIERAKGGKSAD